MSIFLEKCQNAIRTTEIIWKTDDLMWGFWLAKNWYDIDAITRDPACEKTVCLDHTNCNCSNNVGIMLAVPFVSPFAYVIFPALDILFNVCLTVAIWLAIPFTTLVHIAKDHFRKDELQTRINTGENSLISKLSKDEQRELSANLNSAMVQYKDNSDNSRQFKSLYFRKQFSIEDGLSEQLETINKFVNKEGEYNAGRGLAGTILSTVQASQAHLPYPPVSASQDEEINEAASQFQMMK